MIARLPPLLLLLLMVWAAPLLRAAKGQDGKGVRNRSSGSAYSVPSSMNPPNTSRNSFPSRTALVRP
jgi:hypothetical protein